MQYLYWLVIAELNQQVAVLSVGQAVLARSSRGGEIGISKSGR